MLDKELLKETAKLASHRQLFVMSAAPIIEAFGETWEKAEFEARLKRDRTNALYDLSADVDTSLS